MSKYKIVDVGYGPRYVLGFGKVGLSTIQTTEGFGIKLVHLNKPHSIGSEVNFEIDQNPYSDTTRIVFTRVEDIDSLQRALEEARNQFNKSKATENEE